MPIKTKYKNNPEIQNILSDAWLNITVDENNLYNPLDWPASYDESPEKYITWVLTNPEYFSFICDEILNIKILPTQAVMLQEMWHRKFPMLIASRGFGKSFMLGVYAILRALLMPGRKIMLAGAAFRQSKVIFEYIETIWWNAPLLRDIVGTGGKNGPSYGTDMFRFRMNESVISAIPIGDGSKIRGQRANDLITDEFASVSKDIFENVLAGFAAVKASPIDSVVEEASIALAKKMGWWDEIGEVYLDPLNDKDNQIVISGTAYYDFNHFGQYWKDWHEIICSQGNKKKLQQYFQKKAYNENTDDSEIPDAFNWTDYSIIRVPFEIVPHGFMDATQIARSKATIHSGIYMMEFGAVFSTDSNGFFKRSLIENCVSKINNEIYFPSCGTANFEAMLSGAPNRRYVYGVDPASEIDNFCITVIEMWSDHRRVVYCWTTNREQHKKEMAVGLVTEQDFYSYCAKKIRWLMRRFPCERIMMDSQGGGISVLEALHDPDKMAEGELAIWPTIDPDKDSDTDTKTGHHLVEMVNFADAKWTSEANNGLRKDMEDRVFILPYMDPVTLANAAGQDKVGQISFDTLEDCVMEIEELKDELSTIVITQTPSGRDKWDTPEIKLPGGKKGRLRKDRYSSIIMSNMGARIIERFPEPDMTLATGGLAGATGAVDGPMYVGNDWFNEWAEDFYV